MILETGVVTRVAGRRVWVSASSQTECERCAQGRGCGGVFMNALLQDRLRQVKAVAQEELVVGQRVNLALAEQDLLTAAVLSYLLPTLSLVLGALVGHSLWPGDIGAILGSVLGLLMVVGGLRFFVRLAYYRGRFMPTAKACYSNVAD
ncbi:MAG: SoxR reducing system RseC family protein [Pseudomonadota bacterium]